MGLVEVATRSLELVPPHTPQPEVAITLYYEDPNGLVSLRPNARYYTNGDVLMAINEDGFRDRLYDRSRRPGLARFAIVGDSFTMGDGVAVEDSYPDQLETMLNGDGRDAEVINFGVSATNTLQQLEIVRESVLAYSPDVVVLGFNLNDFKVYERTRFERMREVGDLSYVVNPDRTVRIQQPQRSPLERVKGALATRLALVRLAVVIRDRLAGQTTGRVPRDPLTARLLAGQDIPHENWERVNAGVLEMASLVRAHDARFLVLLLPAMTELAAPERLTFADYPYRALHARIGSFLTDAGIDWLDVLPSFGDQPVRPLIVSRFDPHFSREGNAVIARALGEFLIHQGVVEPPSR